MVLTVTESPATAFPITTLPPLMVRAVPAERVPSVAAAAIAVCKLATVDVAPAVNTNVPPVALSWMVVTEPLVRSVPVVSGLPTEP